MKLLLVIAILGVMNVLAGCSSAKVNVDLDSCEKRGQIDGVNVGLCQPVKLVK